MIIALFVGAAEAQLKMLARAKADMDEKRMAVDCIGLLGRMIDGTFRCVAKGKFDKKNGGVKGAA